MTKSIRTLLLLVFCWSACLNLIVNDVSLNYLENTNLARQEDEQPEDTGNLADDSESEHVSADEILGRIEVALALLDGLLTIAEEIEERILPHPKTNEDLLDGVKRLKDLFRTDGESQYKNAEDAISRALFDMSVMQIDQTTETSELQRLLWLERARLLNSNIVLLMEGLLGKPVAGADLLRNIKEKKKCDIIKMRKKMDRYNDLITNGSIAVNHFSLLGQMSTLELNRRMAAVRDRNIKIVTRNIQLVSNCLKNQLNETWNNVTTTEQLTNQVAKVLTKLYPPPIRWIVAVHTIKGKTLRSRTKFKSKMSADYSFHLNGFHIALFPFMEGEMPIVIDGRAVDEFCSLPIREAGGRPICQVGSNDGEFIYDELRLLGIIPEIVQLIVVPSSGQLNIRIVPVGSLPLFFAKRYPDFDIIAF